MSISSDPHGYTLRDYHIDPTQHIVARGPNDHLLERWWYAQGSWQPVVDLSARVGGQLIAGVPHGYTLEPYGEDPTQHIVARGPNDHLLEWWWAAQGSWQLVDLSARVLGPSIAGDPHGYSFYGMGTRQDVPTQHIVARGLNDRLLEWWWAAQGSWRPVVDLSTRVGGQLVASDPHGYTFLNTQHIVARGPNDHLLEWWWNLRDSWQLVDLSALVGGQLIAGDPHGYVQGYTLNVALFSQHIVAQSRNGELLEWYWRTRDSWQVANLSAEVGGQLIAGAPHGYTLFDTRHIVARGPNNELLEWWWNVRDGWQLVDLSALVGGQLIAGDPHGYTLLDTQHIVARGPNNELLEWWWNARDSWQLVNLG